MNEDYLQKLARRIRYHILTASTQAGSGHPTSSLSATELMTALLFGGVFHFDPDQPGHPGNDRLIFSKGHASPLFYALWAAAGRISNEQMMTYREFDSELEGHPSMRFRYTEAATGSLGQGLAIGVGMALNARYLDKLPARVYVLLGDSEMAEGSQWESIQIAAHYKLSNLVGVLDVNRLGQRGPTMYGFDIEAYRARVEAFGWQAITVDGHDFSGILSAYRQAAESDRPVMIIARTVKGKGVSFLEDREGWHGKALDEEQLARALGEIGEVDLDLRGLIEKPDPRQPEPLQATEAGPMDYGGQDKVATRDAYGNALARLYPAFPRMAALDGEVCNSTRAETFRDKYPDRFFEMYIAEQNMAGAALGLARRGCIPCVSTFAAFWTRAFDQIRMAQYSNGNIKFTGSHAGVSIGEDGPSQMALEDIAMFRAIQDCAVLYPCDAVSTEALVEACLRHEGMTYLRTTRMATPIVYKPDHIFSIGGCGVLRSSDADVATVIAAGVTLHEALAAWEILRERGRAVRVIDLYSIKPLDQAALEEAARETRVLLTVEDHYAEGGIGEAVRSALGGAGVAVHSLAVRKRPRSGKPRQLLEYEDISSDSIVRRIMELT